MLLGAGVVGEVRVFAWGLQLFSGFSLGFLAVLRAYVRASFCASTAFCVGFLAFRGIVLVWLVRCAILCAGCSISPGSARLGSGFLFPFFSGVWGAGMVADVDFCVGCVAFLAVVLLGVAGEVRVLRGVSGVLRAAKWSLKLGGVLLGQVFRVSGAHTLVL